jgi:hypothetical protein
LILFLQGIELLVTFYFLQFERGEALEKITQSVKAKLEEENAEDSLKFLSKAVDTVRKQVDHIDLFQN